MLTRLLETLAKQVTAQEFTYSVVVADNDSEQSARATVSRIQANTALQITYCIEPQRNIALVRNASIAAAKGDYIAFIDDDEFPVENWLLQLFRTLQQHSVAGVLAPVLPYFDADAPAWVKRGGLYDRPRHQTGFELGWKECRTGNVLFRRSILQNSEPPFGAEFPNGGEDQDFFRRMIQRGNRFIWCDEAPVHEEVPPDRWDLKIMAGRALLRGKNTLRHSEGLARSLVTSMIAVPCYIFLLPFIWIGGRHMLVRYFIRLCDHLGRLLAFIGLNPIKERVG